MTATILESLVSTKINFSLCQFFFLILLRWNSGQRCRYGRFCTYAHGEEELKSWMEYKNEEQENESDEEQTLDKTDREEAIPRSEVPLLTLSLTLSFPNAIAVASVIFIGFSGIFHNTVLLWYFIREIYESA